MNAIHPLLEDQLYRQLAEAAGLIYIDLRAQHIPGGYLKMIPLALAQSRRWVPMVLNPRRALLIVDDPFEALVFDRPEVAALLGPPWNRELHFLLASPAAMDYFFAAKYPK
jgi:hypothetical protein